MAVQTKASGTPLEKLGFTRGDLYDPKRVIISVESLEKEGKTHFAMTAPAPIVYFDIDIGGETVFKKFRKAGKEIYPEQFSLPRAATVGSKNEVKAHCIPIWNDFQKKYFMALESSKQRGGARTIILDTATDFWNLCLLANVGKDRQIIPQERTQANAIFSEIVRTAFSYSANLILIHKLGKEFDNPTQLERKGFNQIGFLVQTVIRSRKKKDPRTKQTNFEYEITTCRQNTQLEGEKFDGRMYDFATIMADVVEDTDVSDWLTEQQQQG